MIAKFKTKSTYKIPEKFFVEKLLELFYHRTLDSHRAKLNNPKWILNELYQVLCDWHKKKIKHFNKTIKPVILETLQFLDNESELRFESVNKKYFKKLLGSSNEDKYEQLTFACGLIVEDNSDYCIKLFDYVEGEIKNLASNSDITQYNRLSILIDYLATELINLGYSKAYLYRLVSKKFKERSQQTFEEAFTDFKTLSTKAPEDFVVYFRIIKTNKGTNVALNSQFELSIDSIFELKKLNNNAESFFSEISDNHHYLAIECKALDYLAVIEKAKKIIYNILDLINLGFPDNPFVLYRVCLVKGAIKPENAKSRTVNFSTDGYYKNNQDLYDSLRDKIDVIQNRNVKSESILKIISALRHLRLGRDADELEQKFINYWIGLEYIFSNYDVHEHTINRLKDFFIDSHCLAYIKRNLKDFHDDIRRLRLQSQITNYNEDLLYLKDISTFDYIILNFTAEHPLLAFRASKYRELLKDEKIIAAIIFKHKTNLEWHLTRSYRIRNEIVHDAAIHLNIEMITGNLKYYLTFILSSLIEYLNNVPVNINMDDTITIDDFFILQKVKYDSMESDGFILEKLMNEKSPTEIFS